MARSFHRKRSLEPNSELNVTALIDLGFALLIIFMISTPLIEKEQVMEVDLPVADASQNGRDAVLLVRSNIRRFLGELVRTALPKVAVLSYNEVVPAKAIETLSIVTMED